MLTAMSARDLQRLGAAENATRRWSWSCVRQDDVTSRAQSQNQALLCASNHSRALSSRAALTLPLGPLLLILLFRFLPVPLTPLMVVRLAQGPGTAARIAVAASEILAGRRGLREEVDHGAGAAIARGVEHPGGGPDPAVARGNPSCRCMTHLAGSKSSRRA